MATNSLWVTPQQVTAQTILSGDISSDKIIPYIVEAQDIEVFNALGENLYDSIDNAIAGGSISTINNGDHKFLLDTFIRPMLLQYTAAYYLERARYTVSEKGVFIHTAANAQTPSNAEIQQLTEPIRERAESLNSELYDELCQPSLDSNGRRRSYPQYTLTSNNQRPPDHEPYDFGFISL